MTVDTSHAIISGVDRYPTNHRESDIILKHIKRQQEDLSLTINRLALDGGYDVGSVHRGLKLLPAVCTSPQRMFRMSTNRYLCNRPGKYPYKCKWQLSDISPKQAKIPDSRVLFSHAAPEDLVGRNILCFKKRTQFKTYP